MGKEIRTSESKDGKGTDVGWTTGKREEQGTVEMKKTGKEWSKLR